MSSMLAVAFVASSPVSSASLVFAVLMIVALLLILALHGDGQRVLFTCAFVLVLAWTLGMATTYAAADPMVAFGPCGWIDWYWAWFC